MREQILMRFTEFSMNSDNVRILGEADLPNAKEKKLWVKPSIEKIALESAEVGTNLSRYDGHGHFTRNRS